MAHYSIYKCKIVSLFLATWQNGPTVDIWTDQMTRDGRSRKPPAGEERRVKHEKVGSQQSTY